MSSLVTVREARDDYHRRLRAGPGLRGLERARRVSERAPRDGDKEGGACEEATHTSQSMTVRVATCVESQDS